MQSVEVDVSVVLAAYNEEPVLAVNLKRIVDEMSKCAGGGGRWELICVDDGSRDRTGEIMESLAASVPNVRVLHHRRNFGQGRALRTGFDCARGGVIVTLDADLSYGPEYISLLVEALDREKADIALASPYMKGGTVRNVPLYRHFLSRWGNWYLARMSHYSIATSTCVVRAYRREVVDGLILTSDGMELQLEVLMKASLSGFRVCEVPAHLEWAGPKVAEADFKRISKMRVLRTIRLYLLLGWVQRPAGLIALSALVLLLPGIYVASNLLVRACVAIWGHLDAGLLRAISNGLEDIFRHYTYSVVLAGLLLVLGVQMLAFSLLLLQSKFHFDELLRSMQLGRRDIHQALGTGKSFVNESPQNPDLTGRESDSSAKGEGSA